MGKKKGVREEGGLRKAEAEEEDDDDDGRKGWALGTEGGRRTWERRVVGGLGWVGLGWVGRGENVRKGGWGG